VLALSPSLPSPHVSICIFPSRCSSTSSFPPFGFHSSLSLYLFHRHSMIFGTPGGHIAVSDIFRWAEARRVGPGPILDPPSSRSMRTRALCGKHAVHGMGICHRHFRRP
jgi:hypothetical protein